jgi:4'-phosphopantetheinyl transferase
MSPLAARKFVSSRGLLREALARYVDRNPSELCFSSHCRHCGDKTHGRPSLIGGGLEFSLSRTDGMAVVAIAERPVGIDIECRDRLRDAEGVASMALSSRELAALRNCPRSQRAASVLEAWTMKEAYLKGIGVGLASDPRGVEFNSPEANGWRSVEDRAGASRGTWWLCSLAAEGDQNPEFVTALAVTPRPLAIRQLYLEPAASAATLAGCQ